jgi:Protein of unknown function (DUF1254)
MSTISISRRAALALGGAAPMNQLARMRTFVIPDFKNVVRISVSSLWAFGFVDLEHEAYVFSQPDPKGGAVCVHWQDRQADDHGGAAEADARGLEEAGGCQPRRARRDLAVQCMQSVGLCG